MSGVERLARFQRMFLRIEVTLTNSVGFMHAHKSGWMEAMDTTTPYLRIIGDVIRTITYGIHACDELDPIAAIPGIGSAVIGRRILPGRDRADEKALHGSADHWFAAGW